MIKDAWLNYRSTWELTDGVVTVRREATVELEADHCSGTLREILANNLSHIEADYRTAIALKKR